MSEVLGVGSFWRNSHFLTFLSQLVDAIEFSFSCIECTGKQTDVQTGEVLQTVYELLLSSKESKVNFKLNSDCHAEAQYIHHYSEISCRQVYFGIKSYENGGTESFSDKVLSLVSGDL